MDKAREISESNPEAVLRRESLVSRRELLERLSPLGKVELDASRCTGCGLCVSECSTGALRISTGLETDAYQILFRHAVCIACGACVEICPEHCIQVKRVFEPEKIDDSIVLLEDKVLRCVKCGGTLGPGLMVAKIRARVSVASKVQPPSSTLCPGCRALGLFNRAD